MNCPTLKSPFRIRSTSRKLQLRKPFRAYFEALEDRTMLDSGIGSPLPAAIVVGRTLATPATADTSTPAPSYFVGEVQNNQVTITYTVYNEQADRETGVLLTDTLAPGVTLLNSSVTLDGNTVTQLPDQSGQKLAWSLQPINGYDRESVAVTLILPSSILGADVGRGSPDPTPLPLDTGAQAFAMLNAGAVSNSTPAATLIPGNVSDPTLLASTPDANTTDPFIQEQAAKLSYDPQQIFDFLHTQIGYNSYLGSLRGARGTLWSSAGNALDVASLGVALMRASGIPAQYVQGTLSKPLAQQLILSMFPASYQTVGYIPAGTQLSDPANDPQLLAETESHYWFQFDAGRGMQDADPLMAGATIGQTFTTAAGGFAVVAQSLRQTTEVVLTAEIYSQAAAAFGLNPFQDSTVLDQTFNDVDLVGRPLTVGNFVSQRGIGVSFTSITNTYEPYILFGDFASPYARQSETITGKSYQEVLTSFPLASQILSGLFLNMTLGGAGTTSQTLTQTIVDRIGYAARQGLARPHNLSVDSSGSPVINPQGAYSISVMAGDVYPHVGAVLTGEMNQIENRLTTMAQASPSDTQLSVDSASLSEFATWSAILSFLSASAPAIANLAAITGIIAYCDTPRVTTASYVVNANGGLLSLNLAQDTVQAIAPPGQEADAAKVFHSNYGLIEGALEAQVLPVATGIMASGIVPVFQQALVQGIPIEQLTPNQVSDVATLEISADAKARIINALQQGLDILVPKASVSVNGMPTISWYQFNPNTGQLIDVAEDGAHEDSILAYAYIETDEYSLEVTVIQREVDGIAKLRKLQEGWEAFQENIEAAKGALKGVGLALYIKDLIENAESQLRSESVIAIKLWEEFFVMAAELWLAADPSVAPAISRLQMPTPLSPSNLAESQTVRGKGAPVGAANANLELNSVVATGAIAATWASSGVGTWQVQSLLAARATVASANGVVVGAGKVELGSDAIATISGSSSFAVTGTGALSFYGPAESELGGSGDWKNYTATVKGNVSITLTLPTGVLTLNGQALPAATYTITTNEATLSGNGTLSSSNFAGTASIRASNGTVNFGPGSGSLSVGGKPLDQSDETTLDGYTGTINVAANGDRTDSVTLNGNAGNVLQVSAPSPQPSPAKGGGSFTTGQSMPVSFMPNVETSFADTYNLTATAPPGWTVSIDASGKVTATPAPGVQSGTYPIQIIAQSQTNANLVAQTTVDVTITPTQPGLSFTVAPDPLFTVPLNSAQLPTAFRATMQNLGPQADTYNLSFTNIPSGFTLLNSGTSVTVPAGGTGILGLYLQADSGQPLPKPGTQLSFTVTVTSTMDPSITKTQTVSFTMPEIHAVSLVSETPTQNVVPGSGWSFTVDLRNDGNMTEIVHPSASLPAGLGLPGGFFSLHDVSLAPGESVTETASYSADGSLPLNSTQSVTVTASYGPADAPLTQTVSMSVQMILPGAYYAGNLGIVAGQLGRTDLANRLGDLSTALTNLFLQPSSAVFKSQALANLDSVIGQLADDPFLAGFVNNLTLARGVLASASTADQVQNASNHIGGDLNFAWVLPLEAEHSFTLALAPNTAVAQPQSPAYYDIALRNTGSETTTYDFSVNNPPTGLKFAFSQPSITLQPGQAIARGPNGVTLAVSESSNNLVAAGFSVTATAEGAGPILLSAKGTVTMRPVFVSVTEVDATPSFTNPGNMVDVSAKVLNAVNQQEQALASYTIADAQGHVVFTSLPVPLTLTVQASLAAVDIGKFDTTGLPHGSYTITAIVTDTSGKPIPGATGTGSVFIGSPVTASLSVSPATSLPGSPTVTSTLQVTAQTEFPAPLTLLGQVQTTPVAGSVALDGQIAYVAGTNGIDIVDVSDPGAPVVDGTFGGDLIVKGGTTIVRRVGNELIVGSDATLNPTSFTLLIYSLADAMHPQLLSQTPIRYVFMSDLLIQGDTILVPTTGADYFAGVFSFQFGSLVSLDVSNPAKPVVNDVLYNDRGSPDGGDTNQDGGTLVNDHIAYIASSTSSGSSQPGVGRLLVLDYSDPKNLAVLGEVDLPGTVHAMGVAIQGNRALVVGNTGDWATLDPPGSLTGTLTFSMLDTSDPTNPKLLGSTLFTNGTAGGHPLSLGNGLFAISQTGADGKPELLVVDPTDPSHIVVTAISTPATVNEMAVSGDLLYTTSSAGLGIYQIGSVVGEPVTISVQVPTSTGVAVVPGSFNIPPTQILHSTGYDTLVWDRELAFGESQPSFTWQSTVSNLLPGEARDVTLGGTVGFVNQGTAGTLSLAPTALSGVHFIQIDPASQTARPGEMVTFHVTVENPTPFGQQFHLSVKGVPASWISLMPADVGINGNGSTTVELDFTPNASAELGDYSFQVTAGFGFGDPTFTGTGSDTVQATLIVAGEPGPPTYLEAHGIVAEITPTEATAGQGTSARYVVRLTNTGSAEDSFSLQASGLPKGVSATFGDNAIDVPPGMSNFRDVPLVLTTSSGSSPGKYSFTVTATAMASPSVTNSTSATLSLVAQGVGVGLDPVSTGPGSDLTLTVTNTGYTPDSFNLALAGPAALVATLGAKQVTLAPGASQRVLVHTSAADFAVPGSLDLVASATSMVNPTVQAAADASLNVPSTQAVTASISPPSQTVGSGQTVSLLLTVQNTGNTEDSYSATIIDTTGIIRASLIGLDGSPTQSVPIFRLPGLSSGAIEIEAELSDFGQGAVTVRIQSLTNGNVAATATAALATPDITLPHPVGPEPVPGPVPLPIWPEPMPGPLQGPVPADGPRISQVTRYGFHMHPTTVVLTFDQPLDPASASDVHNYRLTGPAGRRIALTSAVYDASTRTVTLHPAVRVNLHRVYQLTVSAELPGGGGVRDTQGHRLDGAGNGIPGSNYACVLSWRNLAPGSLSKLAMARLVASIPVRKRSLRPGLDRPGRELPHSMPRGQKPMARITRAASLLRRHPIETFHQVTIEAASSQNGTRG